MFSNSINFNERAIKTPVKLSWSTNFALQLATFCAYLTMHRAVPQTSNFLIKSQMASQILKTNWLENV